MFSAYKTFLFDFDGTLVDSMPVYVRSMLRILDESGVKYGDDIVKTITPLGLIATTEYYVKLGVPLSREAIIMKMKEYMYDAYCNEISLKPGVFETLLRLKERGASLNVLTASPHVTLDPCLKRNGIFDLFDNVWSCDDFSTTKSDPEIYVRAAKRLGKRVGDVLFLDDNLGANTTAKTAGMKVCGVYDDSSKEYEEQIKAVADHYIHNFAQLVQTL